MEPEDCSASCSDKGGTITASRQCSSGTVHISQSVCVEFNETTKVGKCEVYCTLSGTYRVTFLTLFYKGLGFRRLKDSFHITGYLLIYTNVLGSWNTPHPSRPTVEPRTQLLLSSKDNLTAGDLEIKIKIVGCHFWKGTISHSFSAKE